jgi:hypothetical protein
MARFVTVNVQCDWADCTTIAPEGEDLVAAVQLAIDGKQAREFLLCKAHREDFDDVVLPLMAAGVKVERSPKIARSSSASVPTDTITPDHPDAIVCQIPGCDRIIKKRTGLAQHVIRIHGFESLAAYEMQYPIT